MAYIIAEIGINHNGSLDIAKKLIDLASESGCDAVKFQKRHIETVYDKDTLLIPRDSPWGDTTEDQKKGLEFDITDYDQIDSYCQSKKIDWFTSSWDPTSQQEMQKYNFKHNKVASAMITNLNFLELVSQERKHTFISTGMTTYGNIDDAISIFKKNNCSFTLMHTVSTYPTKDDECNINMINVLKDKYACDVGYSGHEVGLLPSIIAVMKGATSIERHITLDRSMYGSDQSASLEPDGIKRLVRDIRTINPILGDGTKRILDEEVKIAKKLRYFVT